MDIERFHCPFAGLSGCRDGRDEEKEARKDMILQSRLSKWRKTCAVDEPRIYRKGPKIMNVKEDACGGRAEDISEGAEDCEYENEEKEARKDMILLSRLSKWRKTRAVNEPRIYRKALKIVNVRVLDCHISDHRPIFLSSSASDFGPIPFKFYNSWLIDKHLHDIVIDFWEQHNDTCPNPIVRFGKKIKALKPLIKEWSNNRSSTHSRDKEELLKKIKEFDDTNARKTDLPMLIKTPFWLPLFVKLGFEMRFGTVVPNHMVISDFRPISLIGAQYKIIAKVLANRLAKVIDSVIGHEQSAFIKNRQILDGPLMVSEVIQWCKRKKSKLLIYKIDFEKAFNSISWDYLLQVMCFMGFNDTWIKWISGCLFSVTSSILINGSPICEFNINRGLRQEDPLSPFLFIIAMEVLHVALEDDIAARLYRCEWSRDNIKSLVSILECFHRVSGLKIKYHKSNLFGVGVPFDEVSRAALITGCNVIQTPFSCLGLPIDCNMANVKNWDPIVDKFSKRLSKWKSSMLSIGGRATLISSVLGSIVEMSRDVLTVGSTMRIPLLYRGEYSQWVERFMNYLEEQTDGKAMINSIKNGDQPLSRVTQKKTVVVTSDPLALIAEKTNVSRSKEKVVVSSNSEGSKADDFIKMSRDVLTVGSTMRIPFLFWCEYSQWSERFMNYLREQMDGEALINSIKNDKSMWSDQEKKIQKIDRLARSLLIKGLLNEIYSLIDSNKTAKDLWDALERHMLGSKYGEQDRKAAVLYEYETFKATGGELLLNTYIRYLQVINDLKKYGYSKHNYEMNFKFLNNLQPEWKQYATMMRQNKNLLDINIDALYNILKQNQGDVNDAMKYKKKAVVITSDPLSLVTETTKEKKVDEKKRDMSKVKCYNCNKEGHFAKDFKKAKVMDYEYYKTKMLLAKKDKDEQVLLAEGHAWMESSSDSDQEIIANMVFMAQMENVLPDSEESSSSKEETIAELSYYTFESKREYEYETSYYYNNSPNYGLFENNDDDQEIFHDSSPNFSETHIGFQMDHDQSAVDHNNSEETSNLIKQLIREFDKNIPKYQKRLEKANQQSKDFENQTKFLQAKCDVLQNQTNTFEVKNNELNEQIKVLIEKNDDLLAQKNVLQDQRKVKHVVIDTHTECQAKYAKLEAERYEYMIRYSAYFDNDKQHRKHIADQEILFDNMSLQLVKLDENVKCSHWQYKFPLPVKVVAITRRLDMPLPEVCTAIEEKKKLPVKDRWQLH
nr:RNA-directed DNA polymerase, eukaryota, reverse transcriptase zinc-binding domain protein [Tanacetum cinerariifolium]